MRLPASTRRPNCAEESTMTHVHVSARLVLTLGAVTALVACESMPGTRKQQTTAVGAAVGATAGAVIAGEGNRLVGALLGGAVGAAGGYLLGAKTDWFEDEEGERQAREAIDDARRDPATVADAHSAKTADLDSDGFVTFDEMVAMEDAGLADQQMLERLRATDQIFDLNPEQERALVAAGVGPSVVNEMPRINQAEKTRVLAEFAR